MRDYDYLFKLLLVGDGAVGKTSLAHRFLMGLFSEDTRLTVGADFYTKRVVIGQTAVLLQIWDFGGEERYRVLLPGYCNGAKGAIFLFDVTSPPTLYHYDEWLTVMNTCAKGIPVLAAGTKVDLVDARKVSTEEAENYTRARGAAGYLEVSAKTGFSVDRAFELITMNMLARVAPE